MDQTLTRDSESTRLSAERVIPLIIARRPDLTMEEIYPLYRRVNNKHWENFDESRICKIECSIEARTLIWGDVLLELGLDDRELALEIAQIFQCAREETYCCYDDTIPVLQELKEDYSLVLVTNGHSQMQRAKIRVTGLEEYFKAIFIAQEVKVSKPSPAMYRLALDAVGLPADEVLMVGDHPEKDVLGAKQAGLQTAWMRRFDSSTPRIDPQADFLAHDLYDVKALLEQVHV